MKVFLFSLVALIVLSCGRDTDQNQSGVQRGDRGASCDASPVKGRWMGAIIGQPDIMIFESDCSGTSSYCGAAFTYPNVTETSGMVEISVTSTSGKIGCLPRGKTTCAYVVRSNSLHFNCGAADLIYVK